MLAVAGCLPVPQLYLGMSEKEFLQQEQGRANVESINSQWTIYSRCNDWGYNCAYFYFHDGKLCQADHGEQTPDIIIQNKKP